MTLSASTVCPAQYLGMEGPGVLAREAQAGADLLKGEARLPPCQDRPVAGLHIVERHGHRSLGFHTIAVRVGQGDRAVDLFAPLCAPDKVRHGRPMIRTQHPGRAVSGSRAREQRDPHVACVRRLGRCSGRRTEILSAPGAVEMVLRVHCRRPPFGPPQVGPVTDIAAGGGGEVQAVRHGDGDPL